MAMSLHCDVGGSVVRNDIANENRKWLALCRVSCLSRPLLRDSTIQLFFWLLLLNRITTLTFPTVGCC